MGEIGSALRAPVVEPKWVFDGEDCTEGDKQ
jgi:hypothetical protein